MAANNGAIPGNGEIDFNGFPYLNIRKALGDGETQIDKALEKHNTVAINVKLIHQDAQLSLLTESEYKAAAQAVLEKYRKRWLGKLHFHFEIPSEHVLAPDEVIATPVQENQGPPTPKV